MATQVQNPSDLISSLQTYLTDLEISLLQKSTNNILIDTLSIAELMAKRPDSLFSSENKFTDPALKQRAKIINEGQEVIRILAKLVPNSDLNALPQKEKLLVETFLDNNPEAQAYLQKTDQKPKLTS